MMGRVTVLLSGILAGTARSKRLDVEATTLKQAIDLITTANQELREKLLDDTGTPKQFINIYVDGKDYRFLEKLETKLADGSSISIIPAVSGG